MLFEKLTQISEIYDYNHFNDNELYLPYDMNNSILDKSLSPYMFKNDITNDYLTQLDNVISLVESSNVILRNWFNPTVSKYYNRYPN